MRKGRDGEKKKKKITAEIVATNAVASRPPERRPTATPTARAKRKIKTTSINKKDLKKLPKNQR